MSNKNLEQVVLNILSRVLKATEPMTAAFLDSDFRTALTESEVIEIEKLLHLDCHVKVSLWTLPTFMYMTPRRIIELVRAVRVESGLPAELVTPAGTDVTLGIQELEYAVKFYLRNHKNIEVSNVLLQITATVHGATLLVVAS